MSIGVFFKVSLLRAILCIVLDSVSHSTCSERSDQARGRLPYERGGDACLKFWIKPLKETNLGVAQPFLTPKKTLFYESSK